MATPEQISAIEQMLSQAQPDQQSRDAEILALTQKVQADAAKQVEDQRLKDAIAQYQKVGQQIKEQQSILAGGAAPQGFFDKYISALVPSEEGMSVSANVTSDQQRLDRLRMLQDATKKQQELAGTLASYLPQYGPTRSDMERMQAQAAPATSQATSAPAQPTAPAQQRPAEKQGQPQISDAFNQFNEIASNKRMFMEEATKHLSMLPAKYQSQGMKYIQSVAEQRYPVPDNLMRPVIDASTGQPVEGYGLINGKLEKIDGGKTTPSEYEVPGFGIAYSKEDAKDLRKSIADQKHGERLIDQLIEIANKPGSSFSPTDRARAEQIAKMAQGALRLEIVGPGAVTENDRKVLESVVANPTQIFSLKSSVLSSLNNIKQINRENLAAKMDVGIKTPFQAASEKPKQVTGDTAVPGTSLRWDGGKLLTK